jgi:tetratricopeptide (TPR) repeat protein
MKFYQQYLEISERLARDDPQNALLQRDLVISYSRLGLVSEQQGDLATATKFYQQCLEISERLARDDPQNAQAQRDLMTVHSRLGVILQSEFKFAEAIREYTQGIAILKKLIAAGKLPDRSLGELKLLEQQIDDCQVSSEATGDWEGLLRTPAERLPLLLSKRCTLLAKEGRIADVEQAAAKLRTLAPLKAVNFYNAACGYALCVQAIGMSPPTDEKKGERKQDVELALACLKEAVAAGFSDFDQLRKDPELLPLRELPEFQALFPPEKKQPPTNTPEKEAGGS